MQTQNITLKNFFDFQNFPYPDKALPFEAVKTEEFLPLLKDLVTEAKVKIETVKASTTTPDFKNTLVALDEATEKVDLLAGLFSNLEVANGDEAFHEVGKEFYPQLSAFQSDFSLDPIIFQKVKSLYDRQDSLNLTQEEKTILEKYYKGFVRNGALLPEDKKNRLREIDQKMSVLSPQFAENVLKDTNTFQMVLEQKDLTGLPESAIEAAKAGAESKGLTGKFLFTLQGPSYMAFVKYSARRDLREQIWRAFNSRCFGGANDNQKNIHEILQLRQERAQILGYKDHASYVLEERMAKNQTTVDQFLAGLIEPS